MTSLKIANFMNCCGIQIIHSFGNSGLMGHSPLIKDVDKALSDIILKGFRDPNLPMIYQNPPYNFAMQLVAFNTLQHKKYHRMMIRKGFKLIDKGWNLNHKNMNYLYSLHLEKGKKEYKLK